MEHCAALHGLVPWHEYRRLSVVERAEILAHYQEHCLREGIRAQRLEQREKDKEGSRRPTAEDYLMDV